MTTHHIELDDSFIDELLTPDPIQWVDKEMRCTERGCGSPTYVKFQGIPRCTMHTLRKVNEVLKEIGYIHS